MAYKSFEALAEKTKGGAKRTLVVAAAQDAHALEAVFAAADEGIADYILVGDREKIREIAGSLGRDAAGGRIEHAPDGETAAARAVALVREGRGDFLMKGRLETATLMRAALDKERGIRAAGTMSHVGIVEAPAYHKLLAVTDGGMIPHPTLAQKRMIAENAVALFRALGCETPKVAALAASETVNPRQPETAEAAALKEMVAGGAFGGCVLEGPISFDLAISRESAEIKGYGSPVAGDADILVAPDLVSGNMLVKSMCYIGGARMAGCIVGAAAPIILTSRGASAEEKRLSILLCAAAAGKGEAT